jgi:uncharacterized protein YjbJ (UPF0337 family)
VHNDLDSVEGECDTLVGLVQRRDGCTSDHAEAEVD